MINLGRFWLVFFLPAMLCLPARAQLLGTNAFLQGDFVEIGVNECGAYGSDASTPAGYHPTMAGGTLGFVADDDGDGWTGGVFPPYCGDYFLPGSPVEGWGVQIGASVWYNTDQFCSPFGIPGSITSYTTSGDTIRVVWEGNITSESVSVTQTTELIADKSYFVTYVTLCNNSLSTKNNVYYKRNVDPDNDQPWSGSFVTANTIVFQPPADDAALVTSTGTTYGCFLGMGSLATNSRVSWGNFWTTTGSPSDVYNATGGFSGSGSFTSDIANSIAFYYSNIPPGECVCFAFAYILNEDELEEALDATTAAALWVDGEPATPGSSIVVCEPGTPVEITISAPEDYSFTWSPPGIFDVDTGFTVTAYPTTTTTITGTGIGDCGNMSVELILTVADTPTILLEDVSICEGDAVTLDLTATAGDTPCDALTFTNSTITPIPDGAGPPVSVPITVSGVAPATFSTAMFEEVCLSINHTWDADLDITLACPDGTSIVLSSDNGGSGDNYTNTCFVASGAPPVAGGTAPFSGTYTPEGTIAAFTGCTVNGTWTLTIDDDFAADVGTLLYWSISFVCENDFISYDWSPGTGLSDTDVEDPVAAPDTTTTYTVTLTDLIGCTYTEDVTVTVAEPSTAFFDYPLPVYCTDDTDPVPVLDPGAASGTWSSSPAGLVLDALTGSIDLSVSEPGTYTITNSVLGPGTCPDASATSVITVAPSFAFTFSDDICSGDTYILPDGSSATSGGTYTTVLLTVDGCDSLITTILTEHADASTSEDVSICSGDTYTLPDGSTATTSGIYTSTLSTYYGCDSVITTDLTVEPAVSTDISAAICEGDSYLLPDGSSTGTAGSYAFTFLSAVGCDSIVTVDLSVNSLSAVSEDISICDGDIYVLPDGSTATTTGVYVSTLTDGLGCDSVVTTNLVVDEVYSSTLLPAICDGETYVLPDGTSTTTAGTYTFSFVSVAGCDSIITVDLTVNAVAAVDETASICEGDSYLLPDGSYVSMAGTYISVLTTAAGCDSVVTTELGVEPLMSTDLSDAICEGDSYTLPDGSSTSAAGIYTFSFVSAAGCDSTVTLDLAVNSISTTSEDISICDGSSYTLPDGTTVSAAGTYTSVLTDVLGCDSIITTNLAVTETYTETLTSSICEGETYELPDGTSTDAEGSYSFTFTSAAGCDSVINVELLVDPLGSSTEMVSICEGDSYLLPDGSTATTAGTYLSALTTVAGCDSTVTTELIVDPLMTTDLSDAICEGDGYTLPDGSITSAAGTYTFIFTSAAGCDSTVTVDLAVNAVSLVSEDVSICDGGSYILPDGSEVTTAGVYTSTLTDVLGCDSVITTNLSVTDIYSTTLSPAICEGDSYILPDGSSTDTSGTYVFTYISAAGCDSVVTVDLTVNMVSSESEDVSICEGETFTLPDGTVATDPGTYSTTLSSVAGCDSIITTNLSVVATTYTDLAVSICEGESFLLPDGSTATTAGTYVTTLAAAGGCDSIVTVNLDVDLVYAVSVDAGICDGATYTLPDGTVAATSGTYVTTLASMSGCDSVVTTELVVTDVFTTNLIPAICEGETYTLPDGSTTTAAGSYTYTFVSVPGCDSIVNVDLTVNPVYESTIPTSICEGETVVFPDGTLFYDPPAGFYAFTLTSVSGCDSIVNIDLSVGAVTADTLAVSICPGTAYTLPDGSTVTDAGWYTNTLVSGMGCDSVVNVDLSLYTVSETTEEVSICDGGSHTLPDGIVVTTAGTYVSTLTDAFGCDSIITTNVSLTDIYSVSLSSSICDGDSYTLPDGSTTVTAGIYTFTFVSAAGCDSIVTVDLVVHDIYENIVPFSVCDDETIILPDGSEIYDPPAGIYTYTYTTVSGCDSVVGIDLTILPVYDELLTEEICDGGTYILPDGTTTGTAGTYAFDLVTAAGCDSTVTINLDVLPVFETNIAASICEGDAYTLPDGTVTETAGLYTFSYVTATGCDSLVTVDLGILPLPLVDVWMDAEGYCLDAGWQAIGMEPAGGILGGTGITADGFDPDLAGAGGPYDVWYTYTDASGCSDTAWTSVEAWSLPEPELILPAGLCLEADPILLSGTPPGGTYSGDGEVGTDFLASIAGAGDTWVTYTYTDINGCSGSITVPLEVWENEVDAGVDLSLIAGNSIQLLIEGDGVISWSPGYGLDCTDCYDPVASPLQTTTYIITEYDENGCFATDEMTIFVEDLNEYTLFIPNTFTPNGDGQNDYFFINGYHLEDILYFRIYDRWGEVIFDREHLLPGVEQQGWDGSFAGAPVNAGVYAWVAEVLLANGERIIKYGNITLMR